MHRILAHTRLATLIGPKHTAYSYLLAATALMLLATAGQGNKNLGYGGKAITVRSENGPDTCVIDCEHDGRAFHFDSYETAAAVVEGLTIVNGNTFAAIYCYRASPTVADCVIRENSISGLGGGVYCYHSETAIVNCVISDNAGAGVYCRNSGITIDNSAILGNSALGGSGGVYCSNTSLTLNNCTILGNTVANGSGGGVRCGGTTTITNCTIVGNAATSGYGGGVCGWDGITRINNCTILGNSAAAGGGGVCVISDGTATLTNSILWGNSAAWGSEIAIHSRSVATISFCDVQGGLNAINVDDSCTLDWGDGNLDSDPEHALADDYHLMPGSPCVDAGTNEPPGGLPPSDRDGNPRALDGDGDGVAVADMGVYEFNPEAPSIACSGALEFSAPEGGPNPDALVLTLRNCGGGALDWEVIPSRPWLQTDPSGGQSTGEIDEITLMVDVDGLSHGDHVCEIAVSDPEAINSPRIVRAVLHVTGILHVPAEHPTIQAAIDAAVDGDTVLVSDGAYTGPGNKDLDFHGKAITVRAEHGSGNCVIDCEYDGRGFYFHSGETAGSVVEGFTITNGLVDEEGGAICIIGSGPTISGCAIIGNEASDGGGISHKLGAVTISNCVVVANSADDEGGGIRLDAAAATITNCTITGNTAHRGGGVYCRSTNAVLTQCSITGNSVQGTRGEGGGIYGRNDGCTVTNCILWDNAPDGIHWVSGAPVVTYSDVQGGWPGDGNIDVDPALAFTDDPHLMPGSPCIDAGTNDPAGGLPPDDLDGNPRLVDGDGDSIVTVDMGAFEFAPGSPAIACSPASFSSVAYVDGPPDEQTISIRNSGSGLLEWEIVEQCPWLEVSPSSGQSAGEIAEVVVSIDASELSIGIYAGTFDIVASGAVNSPRTVHVTLRVWTGYPTIQSLIDAAEEGDIVVIPDGTYTGPDNRNLDFAGKAITVRSEHGADTCIIDCQNGGHGFYLHSGETSDAIVDGFTIMDGHDGIVCFDNSPTIVNCNITGCRVGVYGEEDYYGEGGSPTIINCGISGNTHGGIRARGDVTIAGCTITGNGFTGGISCGGDGRVWISDCVISGNTASNFGAGVGSEGGDVTIANCTISGNTQAGYGVGGAGVVCLYGSMVVTNCTISGNSSSSHGGGLYWYRNNPVISNCTITHNSAGQEGGGVACGHDSDAILTNCIVWDNSAPSGPQIAVLGGSAVVTYCDVQDGWPGEGNIDADPFFADPNDADYHLSSGSPCIDAGSNCAVPSDLTDLDGDGDVDEFVPFDLDGEGRFFDDPNTPDTGSGLPPIVDMGAYEFGGSELPPCFGDLDGDRDVDLDDLVVLLGHYGMTSGASGADGDMDCDGDIELSDLADFLGAYGDACE